MEIPKDEILQLLRDRGDHDKAQQADQQFPDQATPNITATYWPGSISTPATRWRHRRSSDYE